MTAKIGSKPKAVVYSFEGRWEDSLRSGKVRVFFRKRRPVNVPERIYLYVGVPIKKIIGYAEVDKIADISQSEAISIKSYGHITKDEIVTYMGERKYINAIYIKNHKIFKTPLSLNFLEENFGFNPPQSFSNLDEKMEAEFIASGR
ncbi:putative transcriptional regulator [Sphingobium wenxiniae]|uniref:hypothetical protein n=1 Tax=Sphingobium wenxiniae (strain DSM 21828 / CGMCC 1.7748 / JZ-1) TaxID=595605 RepID=UPI0011A85986|nr:hypothetical protein [Sphingobium wenxiniae]MBB6190871.1 putative transcriptional regulator [Sphingobium wenxiniae]